MTSAYDLAPTLFTLLGVEFDQNYYLGYCVINKSLESGELLSNFFVYLDTNSLFFNNDCLTYDGQTFDEYREIADEYKNDVVFNINKFKARKHYISYLLQK